MNRAQMEFQRSWQGPHDETYYDGLHALDPGLRVVAVSAPPDDDYVPAEPYEDDQHAPRRHPPIAAQPDDDEPDLPDFADVATMLEPATIHDWYMRTCSVPAS